MSQTSPDSGPDDPLIGLVANLAAAISLLERTPKAKKAAASDTMFEMMLADYRKALEVGREFIQKHPRGHAQCPAVARVPLEHAFRAADDGDWAHLDQFIPQSGHGRFWRAVFAEVRQSLSDTSTDHEGKSPPRPARKLHHDPFWHNDTGGEW